MQSLVTLQLERNINLSFGHPTATEYHVSERRGRGRGRREVGGSEKEIEESEGEG